VTPPGLALTDDLIFFSRIAEAARAAGLVVRQARTPGEFIQLAGQNAPSGVVIDLQNPGLEITSFLSELRAKCPIVPRVIAYGSHVETALLRAAREAGCDRVLPRSQFVKELDRDIALWFAPRDS
jgi:CheY-like chemotaxis protein